MMGLAMDKVPFAERGKKIFQTNYAAGLSPRTLLSAAAGAISSVTDGTTGKKIWSIGKPLPLEQQPSALYVFASADYRVAKMVATVGLTLGAIPEGAAGTRFMAVFEDTMGWDIATAEGFADHAMQLIAQAMSARHPEHGGWCMTGGEWRFGHRFDAPKGIPPAPPVREQAPDMPEDIFHNPLTARVFGVIIRGVEPQSLVALAANALGDGWTIEYSNEPEEGVDASTFLGVCVLPTKTTLRAFGVSQPAGENSTLMLSFGDNTYWTSQSTQEAMQNAVDAVNIALAIQFPGTILQPLPPKS
jgi:hypothetical protein